MFHFQAYRHNLASLQAVDDDLPFQRYLLGERPDRLSLLEGRGERNSKQVVTPTSPKYLQIETTYDIRPLLKKEFLNYGKRVRVLVPAAWPGEDMLALDDSQAAAVKACLTQQVAVVQGPPGTGKTYIGLQVTKVLLLNSDSWSTSSWRGGQALGLQGPPKQSPILVLCYTNHALDQFLEGISAFQDTDIIRVGSRSKNPAMDKFNLNNLRRAAKTAKDIPRDIHHNFGMTRANMACLHEDIQGISVMMEAADRHVLSEHELANVLTDTEQRALEVGYRVTMGGFKHQGGGKHPKSILGEWLGVGNTARDVSEMLQNSHPFRPSQHEVPEEEGEGEMDVDEDAHLEEERRIGEDDQEVLDYLKKARRERADRMQNIDLAFLVEEEGNADSVSNKTEQWHKSRAAKRRMKKQVQFELAKTERMSDNGRKGNEKLMWNLSHSERWRLYRTWVHEYKINCQRLVKAKMSEYDQQTRILSEIKEKESLYLMRRAKVVGMTTTGAAKMHKMLRQLKPSIIIVEEAAEVLEAHIVASLTPSCKHLILIGDHQQLRPNPTVYELAKTYNLDVGTFSPCCCC